jgi:hypothetical protein
MMQPVVKRRRRRETRRGRITLSIRMEGNPFQEAMETVETNESKE